MFGRRKNWVSTDATIVLVDIVKVSSDGLTPTRQWLADARLPGGVLKRVQLTEPRWVTDFWPPDAGAVVKVIVDPDSNAARFDVKNDPTLSVKYQDRVRAEKFRTALDEGPSA